jgi:hypothetical protein
MNILKNFERKMANKTIPKSPTNTARSNLPTMFDNRATECDMGTGKSDCGGVNVIAIVLSLWVVATLVVLIMSVCVICAIGCCRIVCKHVCSGDYKTNETNLLPQ